MSVLSINPPYPVFPDIDGQPLEDGYIWIGTAGMNPISNPIVVYWDAALTITAPQPIRTIGGFPARAGSPARLYASSDYSIQVQNKNGSVVYSSANATELLSSDLVTFIQAGAGAVERTAQSKMRDIVSVKDFGAVGDGITNDYQAFQDAIDALPVSGGTVIIPATTTNEWVISQTLNVRKKLHLVGQIAQGTGIVGTKLIFPANTSGIVFNSYNTSLYQTVPPDPSLPGAYGSILENVTIFGDKGGSSTASDGVVIRCSMECRGVAVRNFYRYGFRIYATIGAGGSIEGDANQWVLYRCQAALNGDHGVYVDGDDANTGTALKVFCISNTGYGIYDNSLIGNTYIGCDTAGNTAGSAYCNRSSNASTFIGLWEDGGGTSRFGVAVTSIGANGGNPDGITTGFHMSNGVAKRAPYSYVNDKTVVTVYSSLGKNDNTQTVSTFGSSTEGDQFAWKFKFDETQQRWFMQFANSTSFEPVAYINSSSNPYTNSGFTGPVFQNGYAVKNAGTSVSNAKIRMLGNAAPVAGTWKVGDIIYNETPASGAYIGWVCTVSGTPGTWATFGLIS